MPNYYTTKQFSENFLAMEMKKTKIKMNVPIYIGFTILEISKTVMWKILIMIILNPSMEIRQNYAMLILIALFFILKQKTFIKILLMILKNSLIHQIMRLIDRY